MTEQPTCFKSVTRKAAKQHKCCECGKTIDKGEQYQFSSGIWSDGPESFKQCLNCCDLMKAAESVTDFPDESPSFTFLKEWILNHKCYGYDDEEFLNDMAKRLGRSPEQLNQLLRIKG